ncbi:MAG: Lysozyme [Verrucomicrobiales bacterium]|nr:Lysozyme [Verrucomicrobiales bacterium]
MITRGQRFCTTAIGAVIALILTVITLPAFAQQRVLGVDISFWDCGSTSTGISQANWNTAYTTGSRVFVFHRSSRGGTTGVDQPQGTPGGGTTATFSHRYDDPRFIQNIIRATAAGMHVGSYHFARPDIAGNTGTDEANHYLEMAGAWMRPGYLPPVFDLEAGSGSDTLAQFVIDFSDRIYAVMQIRPGIYINGNYSTVLQNATQARRDAIAKPQSFCPSSIGPDYPMLWDARYPTTYNEQVDTPQTTFAGFYGPWDDYGTAQPWAFWQFSSTASIAGFNNIDTSVDSSVAHGDIEYVRNFLIPAIWWNDTSGDWSTLANWNSGQTPVAPVTPADQATPYATGGLPTPRAPGESGSGPTSGQYDTVVLERTNANITVTLSSGAYNVRKLYMREALNLTGGSLTINYDPTYRSNNSTAVLHGGPISAQFSGPVTLSGNAALTVHTLQVDTNRVFTLAGGILTFNTINLMPHPTAPAKILITGDVSFTASTSSTSVITTGAGSGIAGSIDLNAGLRRFNVGSGVDGVDVSIDVPLTNGAINKAGLGTMRLKAANTYADGTTISAGTLLVNNSSGSATGSGGVTVDGGTLAGTGTISGIVTVNAGGTIAPGPSIGHLRLGAPPILGGTTSMEIARTNGVQTCDTILVTNGVLNYGGTLVVSNIGATLTGGEWFVLFSAPAYRGAFAALTLPPLDAGLSWDTSALTVDGSIKVHVGPPPAAHFLGAPDVSGNPALQFSVDSGWTYYLDRSSDLSDWKTIWTNLPPGSRVINYADPNPLSPAGYYRLRWVP